jgi:hypothetical protein
MKKVFPVLLAIGMALALSGCADPAQRIAAFKAYNEALANCNDKPGCIAATQAAMYGGMLSQPQGDTFGGVLTMALPWGRLVLDGISLFRSGTGNGGYGMLVKGNNNQFIGFNKLIADRGASLYGPFDATATPSMTQSWADMYNLENFRNQNQ